MAESAASKGILTIAKILNTPANTISVVSRTQGVQYTFEALIQGGFSYFGNAEWSSALDMSSGLNGMLNELQARAGIFKGPEVTAFMKNFGSTGLKSVHETVKSYKGSGGVAFTFQCMLVAFNSSIDVMDQCTLLASSLLPYKQLEFSYVNPLLYEPALSGNEFSTVNSNGLLTASKDAGAGTVTVSYSDIFLAPGMLLQSVDFNTSDVLTESGTPLYANVNFTVVPKAQPDMIQFRKYFRLSEKATVFKDIPLPPFAVAVDETARSLRNTANTAVNGTLRAAGTLGTAVNNYVKPFVDGTVNVIGNTLKFFGGK